MTVAGVCSNAQEGGCEHQSIGDCTCNHCVMVEVESDYDEDDDT
jgi:hypothetical protein